MSSSSDERPRFSSSGSVEPSNMCELNSGPSPFARRLPESASSGRRKPSTLSGGAWSVWTATSTSSGAASSRAIAASARAPASASPPPRYFAPPTLTCTIPSDPASLSPRKTPFNVWDEVTFTAGNAKRPPTARSSISAY